MNPDGSDCKMIVTDCHLPDGMVVDAEAGHIYCTNIVSPTSTTARSSELFEPVGDLLHSYRIWDFALSAADRQDRKSTARADLLRRSQPVCPITVKSEERNISKSSPLLQAADPNERCRHFTDGQPRSISRRILTSLAAIRGIIQCALF
jgi:hypothetical protein